MEGACPGVCEEARLRVEGKTDHVDRQALRTVGGVVVLRLHLFERGGRAFVDLQLEDVDAAGMLGDDVRAQKKYDRLGSVTIRWKYAVLST